MEEKEEIKFEEYYKELSGKYELPVLEKLEEDFEVSKFDKQDGKFLARTMRRIMGEKIRAYSQFFEILISPSSPPIFIYSFLKNITPQQKEKIKEIYGELSKSQIILMKLDTIYSEKAEVEFINSFFKTWQNLKKEVYGIIEEIEKSSTKDSNVNKRSYLG